MDQEKREIVKFLRKGDRKAFQFLYLKHEESFKRYAGLLTNNQYAEDLIQLTCLRVLQMDGRKKDMANFNFVGFFCRSLHNTFMDLYRVGKRQPVVELPDNLVIQDPGPYKENDYDELIWHIDKYLTEPQQQVMYMRMKGYRFKQIARAMEISVNTATGHFRYGRLRLTEFKEKILNFK